MFANGDVEPRREIGASGMLSADDTSFGPAE